MPTDFQHRVLGDLASQGHEIDVTAGGLLTDGGAKMADMFRATAVKQGRGVMAWRMLSTVFSARKALPFHALNDTLRLAGAFKREHHREPGDTDFLRGRSESRSHVIRDFVRRMMLPGSGFANPESADNFHEAMEMHRAGQDITWEIVPHSSEMDPVFVQVIAEDAGRYDSVMRRDAMQFLDQTIMVIGHKVRLSVFHRIFAGSLHSLSIYAPKYREGLTDEEQRLMHAYSGVVGAISDGIHASARHMLMRCPEGGRMTRERKIGLFAAVEPAPAYMVPLHVEAPHNFMGVDEPGHEAHSPALVKLYCGVPHQVTGGGVSDIATNRVTLMRSGLEQVGANVGYYSWNLKRVVRAKPGQTVDRSKGAEEKMTKELFPITTDKRR